MSQVHLKNYVTTEPTSLPEEAEPSWSSPNSDRSPDLVPVNEPWAIFTEKKIRLGFIRKVFGIFTLQMLTSFGFIALVNLVIPIRDVVKTMFLTWTVVPLIVAAILFLVLILKSSLTEKTPWNFILLGIFTVFVSISAAAASTLTDELHILYASGMLILPCAVTTLYTFQIRFDLKWYSHLGLVTLSVVIATAVIYWTAPPPPEQLEVLWLASGGALVVALYLTIFLQCAMADRCCFKAQEESYVLVALSAYIVVIGVFFVIVIILGAMNGGCKDNVPSCGDGCACAPLHYHHMPMCYYWMCCFGASSHIQEEEERGRSNQVA